MLVIKEVLNKRDMKKFVMFPVNLYKGTSYYVPNLYADEMVMLDPKKNASLEHCKARCWLAWDNGKVVGRIAGIIQTQDNSLRNKGMIRFSRIDFIDSKEVAHALLDTVAAWGREEGLTILHGPWGFNDQDREGMLCVGFDRQGTMCSNYSYPYYIDHIESYGLTEECEWLEYRFEIVPDKNDRIFAIAQKVKERLKLREIAEELSIKQIMKHWGHKIFDLLNETYKDLEGYVPVSGKVVDGIVKTFGSVADTRFISMLVNEKEELVAFSIAIPSIADAVNKCGGKLFPTGWIRLLRAVKNPTCLEWLLIGVRPDYQARGLNAWLLSRITRNAMQVPNFKYVDSACMLTTNKEVLAQLETLPKELIRRRKCFKKEI